jgi:hypothetical protein
MTDKTILQNYINNFRIQISGILKPNIGVSSVVYPCTDGAIVEFKFGEGIESTDRYNAPSNKIADALATIEQKAFGGNLEAFRFVGTNYIMEFHRLILIKDNNIPEWDGKQVVKDVLAFMSGGKAKIK